MTNEPSPRPWRAEQNVVGWTSFIVDANGDGVAACWRTARGGDEKERQYNEANAALIVESVNERAKFEAAHMEFPDLRPVIIAAGQRDAAIDERDRLRDIVRKTLRAIDALYTVAAPGAIVKELTPDRTCLDVPIGKIVAEARAAIGEDAPASPCSPAPAVVSSSANRTKP